MKKRYLSDDQTGLWKVVPAPSPYDGRVLILRPTLIGEALGRLRAGYCRLAHRESWERVDLPDSLPRGWPWYPNRLAHDAFGCPACGCLHLVTKTYTAAEPLSAGDPVYFGPDGKLHRSAPPGSGPGVNPDGYMAEQAGPGPGG